MRFIINSFWTNEIVLGILILIAVLIVFAIIGFIIDAIISYAKIKNNNGYRQRAQYYIVEISTEFKFKKDVYEGTIATKEKKKKTLHEFFLIKSDDNFLIAFKPTKTLNDFDLSNLEAHQEIIINKQEINEYLTVIASKQYNELTAEEIVKVKKLSFSFRTGIEFTVTNILMQIAEYIN